MKIEDTQKMLANANDVIIKQQYQDPHPVLNERAKWKFGMKYVSFFRFVNFVYEFQRKLYFLVFLNNG